MNNERQAVEILKQSGCPTSAANDAQDFKSIAGLDDIQATMSLLNREGKVDELKIVARYVLQKLTDELSKSPKLFTDQDVLDTIIESCFRSLTICEIQASILIALQPEASVSIRNVIIAELAEKVEADIQNGKFEISQFLSRTKAILIGLLRCLAKEEAGASTCLNTLVKILTSSKMAPNIVLTDRDILREIQTDLLLSENSQERFRLHDLTVELSKQCDSALEAVVSSGLLQGLVDELKKDDLLGQLTGLELLAQMSADNERVAAKLHDMGVIPQLHDLLDNTIQHPDSGFLFPACIRFFGYLCRARPAASLKAYPYFLQSVFDLIFTFDQLDVAQRLLGFDTLAVVGESVEGKAQLGDLAGDYKDAMQRSMKCFSRAICNGPLEVRARHLQAFTQLIELKSSDQTPTLLALTEKWFNWTGTDWMGQILAIYRQPIEDIRMHAGRCIKVLALQSWAVKIMARQAGFLEFLLDRSTEHDAPGRLLKYEIVSALINSDKIEEAFESSDILKLRLYEREGPYYTPPVTAIAMENA